MLGCVEQSGEQVIYVVPKVRGVKTNPVKGELHASEALTRLVAGTDLVVVEDQKTGAFIINRGTPTTPLPTPPAPTAPPKDSPSKNPNSTSVKSRNLLKLLAGWFAAGIAVDAQTAQSPTAVPKTDEVVELSPFEVKETSNWNAPTTLLSNRVSQDLTKVPATIDVLTSSFMNDIGVYNLDDAAVFVAGVTDTPQMEARSDYARMSFRGLAGSASDMGSRNLFRWYVPADTYNVERFDFGKGSNSLMFGDSPAGGQANITTKRPRFANMAELMGFYDSYDSHRLQLDVNRKLTKNLAIRFNAVDRSEKSYVHGNFQQLRALDLAVLYRPFRNTTITVEAERGKLARSRSGNSDQIRNIAALGLGYGSNNHWYYTSDGTIAQRTNTLPANATDRSAASGTSVSFLEGQVVAVKMPDGASKSFAGLDRSVQIQGPYDYLNRPYNTMTVTVEQSIGKLSLEAAFNQQFQHQDRVDASFGGSTNSPTISVDSAGRPYVDNSGSLSTFKVFGNIVKAGRLSASYPFEIGKWSKQQFVGTVSRTQDYAWNRRLGLVNTAAPGNVANNGIIMRAYLDDPRILSGNWGVFQTAAMPHTAIFSPDIVESYTGVTGPFLEVHYMNNYSGSLSGDYFGGRLTSLVGWTYNNMTRKIPTAAAYTTDPVTGRITFSGTPDSAPTYFTYDPDFNVSSQSKNFGLGFELVRRENLNVNLYGVYSQSFSWAGSIGSAIYTFDGKYLGPMTGTTHEIGLKGDVFHGKVFYSLAVFDIARQNVAYGWSSGGLSSTQIEDLFNPNNLLLSDPHYFHVTSGLHGEDSTVPSDEKSRGVDFTLIGQRIHGLQARVTFSKQKVESARDFSGFSTLLAAAITRTTAALAPGGNAALAENASYITAAQNLVAANSSSTIITDRRSAPYTASTVLDYQFTRPASLRVGLTAVLTPNYNIDFVNNVVFRGGASCPIGLYASYDYRLFGQRANFRLGVKHLYDLAQGNSKYYKTSVNSVDAITKAIYYRYRYVDQMSANLSATVKF